MLASKKEFGKLQPVKISTGEAFYKVFRALPKKDQVTVVRYILEDKASRRRFDNLSIPNKTTLKAFSEDKSTLPAFHSVKELRKDLTS